VRYQDAITDAMFDLSRDPMRRFLGYNVGCGNLANGTLARVPAEQRIETPAAENLMVGLAIGLSLEGYKPVVWFERFDFVLNALDAIVNHADKLNAISRGQYAPQIIFRVNVGGKARPLFSGPTHTQDFTKAVREMVKMPVYDTHLIAGAYRAADEDGLAMVIEHRDSYDA